MAGEVIAGLGIFKTIFDVMKGLKDVNDAAIRDRAVIELQEHIVAAQLQQSALIDRVRELEEQVANFENWEAEKKRYQLVKLPPGTYVRRLRKEAMQDGEPEHDLCAACFEKRKKGYLQETAPNRGRTRLTCSECGTQNWIGHPEPHQVVTRGKIFRG